MGENQEEMEQKSENKLSRNRLKQSYYIKTLISSFSSEQDSKFLDLQLLSSAFSS